MCKTNDVLKRLYDRAGDVLALTRKLLDDAGSCECAEKAGKQNPVFAACSELKTHAARAEVYGGEVEKYRLQNEVMKRMRDTQYAALSASAMQAVKKKNLNADQPASTTPPDDDKRFAIEQANETLQMLITASNGDTYAPMWLTEEIHQQVAFVRTLISADNGG